MLWSEYNSSQLSSLLCSFHLVHESLIQFSCTLNSVASSARSRSVHHFHSIQVRVQFKPVLFIQALITLTGSVLFSQFQFYFFHSRIPPHLKPIVYCNAIATGGVEEWDFGWKMFKNSTIGGEAEKLLFGLSCTKVPWLLNR